MRRRDPRRLIRRGRAAAARVRIVPAHERGRPPQQARADGDEGVTTRQVADVTLPRSELERIWRPEYLERLARTYWRFLTRISAGLLRVRYSPEAREIVLIGRPLVLLRFKAPEYEAGGGRGAVTWRIERGLLVAPAGRGRGYLRIAVERRPESDGRETVAGRITAEVANFYPAIAGWGAFNRVGRHIYRATQMRIHTIVTNAFLRSLARLDLAESRVGALRPAAPPAAARMESGGRSHDARRS